ncbi:MAG: hypothetical protein K2N05_06060 [Muribaculaceae bacterium]|nr:hypothetical protein [Muribaculaceae bacterium]
MSEKELNSYRFLSGEDPTDEMLECIMRDALESAMNRRREAEKRIKAEVERQRKLHKEKWYDRLNSYSNEGI